MTACLVVLTLHISALAPTTQCAMYALVCWQSYPNPYTLTQNPKTQTLTTAVFCIVLPLRYELLPVRMDAEGLDPHHLQQVLADRQSSGLPMPKVLYLIPTGAQQQGTSPYVGVLVSMGMHIDYVM